MYTTELLPKDYVLGWKTFDNTCTNTSFWVGGKFTHTLGNYYSWISLAPGSVETYLLYWNFNHNYPVLLRTFSQVFTYLLIVFTILERWNWLLSSTGDNLSNVSLHISSVCIHYITCSVYYNKVVAHALEAVVNVITKYLHDGSARSSLPCKVPVN